MSSKENYKASDAKGGAIAAYNASKLVYMINPDGSQDYNITWENLMILGAQPGTLEFSAPSPGLIVDGGIAGQPFVVSNNDTNLGGIDVQFYVDRVGGKFGQLQINYITGGGKAIQHTNTSGTLTWAHGDDARKTVTIHLPYVNNGVCDYFGVTFSGANPASASPGQQLGINLRNFQSGLPPFTIAGTTFNFADGANLEACAFDIDNNNSATWSSKAGTWIVYNDDGQSQCGLGTPDGSIKMNRIIASGGGGGDYNVRCQIIIPPNAGPFKAGLIGRSVSNGNTFVIFSVQINPDGTNQLILAEWSSSGNTFTHLDGEGPVTDPTFLNKPGGVILELNLNLNSTIISWPGNGAMFGAIGSTLNLMQDHFGFFQYVGDGYLAEPVRFSKIIYSSLAN